MALEGLDGFVYELRVDVRFIIIIIIAPSSLSLIFFLTFRVLLITSK
jgi:hypothetical protein